MTSASGQQIDQQEIGTLITELYGQILGVRNEVQREQIRLLLLQIELMLWI